MRSSRAASPGGGRHPPMCANYPYREEVTRHSMRSGAVHQLSEKTAAVGVLPILEGVKEASWVIGGGRWWGTRATSRLRSQRCVCLLGLLLWLSRVGGCCR